MKVIGKIFAVIICVVYFFLLTGLMVAGFGTNIVSSNYYSNVFESIDLEKLKVSDLSEFFNEGEFDEDATLEDVVIEYFAKENPDEAKIKVLINDKKVRKTAGKVLGDIISYSMGGEKPEITRNEIEDFFNNPVVKDVTGEPTEENIDYVYDQLNKAIEEVEGGMNGRNAKRNSSSVKIPG